MAGSGTFRTTTPSHPHQHPRKPRSNGRKSCSSTPLDQRPGPGVANPAVDAYPHSRRQSHWQSLSPLPHWQTSHSASYTAHSPHIRHHYHRHFALNTCVFRACNTTYKQIRGAGIGSQLSPALCNVAITLIEHSWFLSHPAIQTLIHHTPSNLKPWISG